MVRFNSAFPSVALQGEPSVRTERRPHIQVWACELSGDRSTSTSNEPIGLTARRALLRILSEHFGLQGKSLTLESGPNGTLFIRTQLADRVLRLSVSHCGDVALFAFSMDAQVGVDVERLNPSADVLSLARRCLSAPERARLCELPEDERVAAFYRCWTAKEAFSKALGSARKLPADAYSVGFLPGDPRQVQILSPPPPAMKGEAERWFVIPLTIGDRHFGAIACGHASPDISFHGSVAVRRSGR